MMSRKPLNRKCYGHIPHLSGSRMINPGDHRCNIGDEIRATIKPKDRHDRIIVLEKLDGTSVGVGKMDGICIPLVKSGYLATSSKYLQHRLFANWVYENVQRFDKLLNNGERVCGEWLAMAHSTRYKLKHEPFVIFDIMVEDTRVCFPDVIERVSKFGFVTPHIIHLGCPLSVDETMNALGTYGFHGAIDPIEGAVWRIERNELVRKWETFGPRKWIVENLVKYVRPDKKDGIYFREREKDNTWNWYPKKE